MIVKIKITERLVQVVSVEADNKDAARQKVDDLYRAGEIVLTADDFVGYTLSKA